MPNATTQADMHTGNLCTVHQRQLNFGINKIISLGNKFAQNMAASLACKSQSNSSNSSSQFAAPKSHRSLSCGEKWWSVCDCSLLFNQISVRMWYRIYVGSNDDALGTTTITAATALAMWWGETMPRNKCTKFIRTSIMEFNTLS